jgi:hypothetical protein
MKKTEKSVGVTEHGHVKEIPSLCVHPQCTARAV